MSGSNALRVVALLGLVLLGAWLVTEHVAIPWVVSGPSMEPTLRAGDRVIVDLWTYRRRLPRPGELVLLDGPAVVPGPLIKRVAPAPAVDPASPGRPGETATVWVLGDNPAQSADSRAFGPVPVERLRGRVVWRYWPPSRAGRP